MGRRGIGSSGGGFRSSSGSRSHVSRSSSMNRVGSRSHVGRSSSISNRSHNGSSHSHISHGHAPIHRPRTSIYVFGGSPYRTYSNTGVDGVSSESIPKSKISKILTILLIVTIVLTVICLFLPSCLNPVGNFTVQDFSEDYIYYNNMIDDAYDTMNDIFPDNDLIVEGTIENIFKQEYSNKYYFIYSYYDKDYGTSQNKSYAVFDKDDIGTVITEGDTIEIALDRFSSDSMPVIMKNYNYEDDGDYIALQEYYSKFGWLDHSFIYGAIIIVGLIIAVCISYAKDRSDYYKMMSDTEKKISINKEMQKRCKYCGTAITPNTNRCSGCGASVDYMDQSK